MSPVHVIISGASSVGKSTLMNMCLDNYYRDKKLKNFNFKRIDEVARTVLKRIGKTGSDLMRFIESNQVQAFAKVQKKIIEEQLKKFEDEKDQNYISDRSGFDALAYVHHYFNDQMAANSLFQSETFQSLIRHCVDALLFIVHPQEQLTAVDDKMRIVPSYADQINYTECLKYWYQRAGLSFFVLSDLDLDKRVQFITDHVNGNFCWSPPRFSLPLRLPFHLSKTRLDSRKSEVCQTSKFDNSNIRRLNIIDEHRVKISYQRYNKNRLIEKYDSLCINNRFCSIQFDRTVEADFVQQILLNGIFLNGEHYNFIGYSNSQLKERSCYLYAGSIDEIQRIIDSNGDFHQIKSISKRTARIGLLFSSGIPTISVSAEKVSEIDDIERNGFVFTDGCGIIGRGLAKQIVPYLNDFKKPIINLNSDQMEEHSFPCAYQIRYQGYKGVLMVNDDDDDDRIQMRPSMKKFNGTISSCLNICDDGYATPRLGFLSKQYLMLLSGLGIPDEVFLRKQDENFSDIESMCSDMNVALKYCLYYDRIDLIHYLLSNEMASIQSDLRQFQRKSIESLEKLKIPISKSRLAFGVCDPYGVLKPGECFFRPTCHDRQMILTGKVCFVAKSPSYHLGDIRTLKLTFHRELEHLYDVLVFPTQGQRPHPNEIAGSDLDGDKYLICWDEDLIPKRMSHPMNYSSNVSIPLPLRITREDIVTQFSHGQKNNKSGLIDKYFNIWANLLGVRSTQCRRLAQLFSAAVDAPKTGENIRIPPDLKPPQDDELVVHHEFVWMKMLKRAKEFREKFRTGEKIELLTKETLLKIFLERRQPLKFHLTNSQTLSEFDLIVSTIKWCRNQENSRQILDEFLYLFDLSQLTIVEKREIEMSLIDERFHLNSILRRSSILSKELFDRFRFDELPFLWRLFYVSPRFFHRSLKNEIEENLQPMIYVLSKLDEFERTLINISIDETIGVVLELDRHALIEKSKNIFQVQTGKIDFVSSKNFFSLVRRLRINRTYFTLVVIDDHRFLFKGLFNVYFESKLFSIRRKFRLDATFFVQISSNRIQIYENTPGNSFIVFMFDEDEEQTRISVDLTRFERSILRDRRHPKVNKHRYTNYEIFVLSDDSQRSTSFYPLIHFHDDDFHLHNYFNDQIDQYEYVEYLSEQEKKEEKEFETEQKRIEDERIRLISQSENLTEENLLELVENWMKINETTPLKTIYQRSSTDNQKILAEKLFDYFIELYRSMINGSIYRPLIDEQFFYQIFIDYQNQTTRETMISLVKEMNRKCSDFSQPAYLPNLARILHRFCRENPSIHSINNELLYDLTLSLLLANGFNSDETQLNVVIDLQTLTDSRLTFKQILHLIRCCLMAKNVQYCSTFIEYFLSIPFENSTQIPPFIIDYVQKFLSMSIRMTSYEIDEIDRRTKTSRAVLIQNGESLFDLRATWLCVKNSEEENEEQSAIFHFRHCRDEQIPSHRMNIGDTVALIDQNQIEEKVPLRLFYQGIGTIQSIYPRLIVKFPFFPSSLTKINCFNRRQIFRLERLPNFVTLNRSIEAMIKIVENKDDIPIQPFLNLTDQIQIDRLQSLATDQWGQWNDNWSNDANFLQAHLNETQRLAIRRALEQRLTLIQGPPGTGKTETSAWIIHLWLKYFAQTDQIVLVCAETHQAVDNLTRRLLQFQSYRLVRYAEPRTVSSDLQEWTMQRHVEMLRLERQKNDQHPKKSLHGPARPREIREVISSCQILCMSASGVGILEKSYRFPFILIDEASQITEPNILIPLTKITGQIVLVGDQKQLPPIIKMTEAKELLERSLFRRLLENLQIHSIMLDTQYRMHPALIEFPSKTFYHGQLKTGVTPDLRPLPSGLRFIDAKKPLMFVDVENGVERIRGANIHNIEEAKLIVQTIESLLPKQRPLLSPSDIGVITPYTKQVKEIVEQLSKYQIPKGVEIRTVDGFQGREKEIILISLVRSNDQEEIGFLTNQQRMNVLLTRAKCAMIIFGNKQTLRSNDLWREWIDHAPNISAHQFTSECLIQPTQSTDATRQKQRPRQRPRRR